MMMGLDDNLPPAIKDWAGLPSIFGFNAKVPLSFGSNVPLSVVNDRGMTFLEIADIIEAQV
jgi:hypothetical protein